MPTAATRVKAPRTRARADELDGDDEKADRVRHVETVVEEGERARNASPAEPTEGFLRGMRDIRRRARRAGYHALSSLVWIKACDREDERAVPNEATCVDI